LNRETSSRTFVDPVKSLAADEMWSEVRPVAARDLSSISTLEALLSSSVIMLVVLDRDARVLMVNDASIRFTGLPTERALGRSVEHVWPVIGPRLRAAVDRVLDTGEPILRMRSEAGGGAVIYDILPVREDDSSVDTTRRGSSIERVVVLGRDRDADDIGEVGKLDYAHRALVDVLGRLVRMTVDDYERVLAEALGEIAASFGCERAIGRLVTGECFRADSGDDGPHVTTSANEESRSANADLFVRYALGETLAFPSLDAVPDEHAAVRARLQREGCRAACSVPIVDGARLLGRIVFMSVRDREWSETVQLRLRLFGEMFGTAHRRVRSDAELRDRLRFEEALATVTSRLLDVPGSALDDELTAALGMVTTALHMDRTVIALMDDAREQFVVSHEWCAPGVESFHRYASEMPIARFGWPLTKVADGETINMTSDEIPDDAINARRVIGAPGVGAVVLLPLMLHGDVLGCLLFQSLGRSRCVHEGVLARLRVAADVLAGAIVRRWAAESLRESETCFTQVIESSLDGVVVVDEAGVILEWNAQAERLFARQRFEVVGRVFADLAIHTRDRARVAPGSLNDGRLELMGVDREQRAFPIEVSIARLVRDRATIFAMFVRDITERRRVEEESKRAISEITRTRMAALRESEQRAPEILGRSPAILQALEHVQAVATTNAAVLICGESGVGKELFARAVHTQSLRAMSPLVKVNCASIPESLFESEFFGHVRGAFTGAHKDRVGRFELADGGTLFLDEVGEIPPDMQAKLLRVLQEGEFERIGDDRTRKVDVRIVAATVRDLAAEVQAGRFRRDLFYRLSVFPIEVPPLRDRPDDIVPLAESFLGSVSRAAGREGLELTAAHRVALLDYAWPGNVRELHHVIERAVILSPTPPLRLELGLPMMNQVPGPPSSVQSSPRLRASSGAILTDDELRKLERDNLVAALDAASGRVAGDGGAAELLGVNPSTLRDRMKALGIGRR
jgi:PAS domain S-box-containing protein